MGHGTLAAITLTDNDRTTGLIFFGVFVLITIGITFWASRRTKTTADFYAAGRSITGVQNGIAVAGDYMSAASFLGIAGLIAFNGYDGFMYSVGWLVAYLTVLLLVAEPLRNTGKYTMADVLAYRLKAKPVRAAAAFSTLTVSTFYMIAQMVGAGTLVNALFKWEFWQAVTVVGIIMICYVVFGGMLATTWVQIIKAVLLIIGTIILSLIVLSKYNFDIGSFFNQVAALKATVKTDSGTVTKSFLDPGIQYATGLGKLDLISLGMALIFGTAGLPHILVRFYTVPTAKAARISVVWAMILIGGFYIMTTFLGFGAALAFSGEGKDAKGAVIAAGTQAAIKSNIGTNNNLAAPLLALQDGGTIFFAFISAVAFATILAVVAGLTVSASSAIAHDFWLNIVKNGKEDEREQVIVARITALIVGALSIGLAIVLGEKANVAYLVGLAFAVAASANLPVVLFSLFWRRFNTAGAVTGILGGLFAAIVLIIWGPNGAFHAGNLPAGSNADVFFPLTNPGIVSIPVGFACAILGTLVSGRERTAEAKFPELYFRQNTGVGAEA